VHVHAGANKTNLVMWVRDQYFPATYRQAIWTRLAPFFRLPGLIMLSPTTAHVALRPFNDRALTHDLALLCERLGSLCPRLPAGRALRIAIASGSGPLRAAQSQQVA
jgi:hypothetical protein